MNFGRQSSQDVVRPDVVTLTVVWANGGDCRQVLGILRDPCRLQSPEFPLWNLKCKWLSESAWERVHDSLWRESRCTERKEQRSHWRCALVRLLYPRTPLCPPALWLPSLLILVHLAIDQLVSKIHHVLLWRLRLWLERQNRLRITSWLWLVASRAPCSLHARNENTCVSRWFNNDLGPVVFFKFYFPDFK